MTEYRTRAGPITSQTRPAPPQAKKKFCLTQLAQLYGVTDMMDFSESGNRRTDQTIDEEFLEYINGTFAQTELDDADIIAFWEVSSHYCPFLFLISCFAPQKNELRFPTLFAIALDYLPIQASAVPCERVFSSSAETDTKRRNRIHPMLMEALQIVKFSLKQKQLDFMEGWATTEHDLEDEVEDEPDLLAALLTQGPRGRTDGVIAAILSRDDEES
jgi:hypothetical protein